MRQLTLFQTILKVVSSEYIHTYNTCILKVLALYGWNGRVSLTRPNLADRANTFIGHCMFRPDRDPIKLSRDPLFQCIIRSRVLIWLDVKHCKYMWSNSKSILNNSKNAQNLTTIPFDKYDGVPVFDDYGIFMYVDCIF